MAIGTRRIWLTFITALLAYPALAEREVDFSGHYYLSGVMETGSELLLKSDKRFEWFISYGAVDRFAQGRWERRGDTIALDADVVDRSKPLFTIDRQAAWDADAESRLREAWHDEQRRAADVRCPFLHGTVVAATAPILKPGETVAADAAAKARAAVTVANQRRDEAERAMAAAIVRPSETSMVAASEAMTLLYMARSDVQTSHYEAKLPIPELAEPEAPQTCSPPPLEQTDPPPSKWRRGVAVVVGDPAVGQRFPGIEALFEYGDGSKAGARTDIGGFAAVPVRAGVAVTAVTFSFEDPAYPPQRLAITAIREGIQFVRLDSRQLAAAPFETLVLKIDGNDLLLDERGRYSRN